MLEKPAIDDAIIIACLRDHYAVAASQVEFLPLGADVNTAVYRVLAADGALYFLKLRRGAFAETSVALPRFLHDHGVPHLIPPLPNQVDALWSPLDSHHAELGTYHAILYPFVAGRNGYEVALTDSQWVELGAAFKRIHTASLPTALAAAIPRETYTPRWRERVRAFQARAESEAPAESGDRTSSELVSLLKTQRAVITDLVDRAERLAVSLQSRSLAFVVCHADLHAGNLLMTAGGAFYIVDWDTLIFAPKERDLMYVGGAQMANRRPPQEEESLFYAGYGQTEIDHEALAYYRYERIVQDIAEFCQQIFQPSSSAASADREEGLRLLAGQFEPDGVIAFTHRLDRI